MTDNKYYIFLENLRKTGKVNMYGASEYLMCAFNLNRKRAEEILLDWMKNYKQEDYK